MIGLERKQDYRRKHFFLSRLELDCPSEIAGKMLDGDIEGLEAFFQSQVSQKYIFQPTLLQLALKSKNDILIDLVLKNVYPYNLCEKSIFSLILNKDEKLANIISKAKNARSFFHLFMFVADEIQRACLSYMDRSHSNFVSQYFDDVNLAAGNKINEISWEFIENNSSNQYEDKIIEIIKTFNYKIDSDIYIGGEILLKILEDRNFILAEKILKSSVDLIFTINSFDLMDYIETESISRQMFEGIFDFENAPMLISTFLIQNGVDFGPCGRKTPLDTAIQQKHKIAQTLLEAAGAKTYDQLKHEADIELKNTLESIWGA